MMASAGSGDEPCEEGHRDYGHADRGNTGRDAGFTEGYAVGHRRPPKTTRFAKGVSGNPRGRPKGKNAELPHEAVLGRKVTIRKDGREQQVTAEEAFLLHIGKAGMDGDGPAARTTLAALERVRVQQSEDAPTGPTAIDRIIVAPGSVTRALESLHMARRLDAYRETARIMLEPWIVEAALKRLGSRRLSHEEQKVVLAATRTPKKVQWPGWWVVKA